MATLLSKDQNPSEWTPIPTTAFEHYMYADDRADMPMTFFIRLSFEGIIDQNKFNDALMQALPRHVLFQALLNNRSGVRGKNLKWIPLPKTRLPYVDYSETDSPYRWPDSNRNINLQKEIGLRFFTRAFDHKTTVMMQVHHSCSDALGALSFIEDVMSFYHSRTDHLKIFTHKNLLKRECFQLTNREVFRRYGKDFARALKFFSCIPKPMAQMETTTAEAKANESEAPLSETVYINKADFDKIQTYCRKNHVTLNDLFLKELFITLDLFNKHSGSRKDYFRISMPINMRDESHAQCPSANIVSMCFIDRRRESFKDESSLIQSIAEETRNIKKFRLGLALIKTTKRFSNFKGGMNFLVTPKRPLLCYATLVLSNLGRVFSDSRIFKSDALPSLKTVELLPPIRPYTHAAIGISSFKDKLAIAMHYDGSKISDVAARSFLDNFKVQLLKSSLSRD